MKERRHCPVCRYTRHIKLRRPSGKVYFLCRGCHKQFSDQQLTVWKRCRLSTRQRNKFTKLLAKNPKITLKTLAEAVKISIETAQAWRKRLRAEMKVSDDQEEDQAATLPGL